MKRKLFLLLFIFQTQGAIVKTMNKEKIEISQRVSQNLNSLNEMLKKLDQELNDKKLNLEKERKLISELKSENVKQRKLSLGGGSSVQPAVIDIPIPRIKETELEVVHVFPQGYPGGYGGGGYGGGYGSAFSPNLIPSYSVTTNLNGGEEQSNFWGFNPSG